MSEIENGGPAFPFAFTDGSRVSDGMTLLDYFAAKAMQSCIQTCANDTMDGMSRAEYFAKKAYECADAMLAARSKAL